MSKLEELIQLYCPDGVEYVKLGDFATEWYRGAGIKKDEVSSDGIPCIRYGEIHTTYSIWFDKCVSHTDENKQPSRKYAEYGNILFAITSEDIPFVGNSVAYVGKERILVGGDIVVMKHTQNPKFISYALSTNDAVKQKGKGKVKSKVVHTNVSSLQKITIPLPPLPVQEEIVRILDTYSELQTNLQIELQAELPKRVLQYNFYRDNLLSFESRTDVEWKRLGEITRTFKGAYITQKGSNEGSIPVVLGGQEPAYYIDIPNHEGELVAVSRSGVSAGFVSYWKEPIYITDGFGFEADTGVLSYKYLYYALKKTEPSLQQMKRGAGVPHISYKELVLVEIPIPSLEEQSRIVSILDRLETLITDLSQGLPSEVEKRRQQYEYYRDKLLTFKRA